MDDSVLCPYCGEAIELEIDDGGGRKQDLIEDCPVCCKPMRLMVTLDEEGEPSLFVQRLDE